MAGTLGLSFMFAASCIKPGNFWLFQILYPLSWSLGNGFGYYVGPCEAWKFFPDKPCLTSGIIIAGFGGGAFIFDNVSTALVNPNDYKIGTDDFNNAVQ